MPPYIWGPKTEKKGVTKKPSLDPPFLWTEDCEEAFESLRNTLTCAPVLGYPGFNLPFVLQTDASGEGLGAVLAQVQNGQERVIAYASRGLSPPETRYPAHKLEFLALKWAVTDKFYDHLYGRRFSVLTENTPLKYVMSSAKLDVTGQRWVSQLAAFDFDIQYRKGNTNANADALSRMSNQEVAKVLYTNPQHVPQQQGGTQALFVSGPPDEPLNESITGANVTQSSQAIDNDEPYNSVGTEALPAVTTQEIRMGQKEDPVIGPIWFWKNWNQKPSQMERAKLERQSRLLLKEWGRLLIKNGIMYRVVKEDQNRKN